MGHDQNGHYEFFGKSCNQGNKEPQLLGLASPSRLGVSLLKLLTTYNLAWNFFFFFFIMDVPQFGV